MRPDVACSGSCVLSHICFTVVIGEAAKLHLMASLIHPGLADRLKDSNRALLRDKFHFSPYRRQNGRVQAKDATYVLAPIVSKGVGFGKNRPTQWNALSEEVSVGAGCHTTVESLATLGRWFDRDRLLDCCERPVSSRLTNQKRRYCTAD